MIEELEGYIDINSNKIKNFINFLQKNNLERYLDSIVSNDEIVNIIKKEINENGWKSVHNKLSQISSTEEDYYFIDGYSNFRNLRVEDINKLIDEIKNKNTLSI